ncbi:hypothetical protein [Haloarchaeobius sp. DT45]|uniref:hypothetical protein n=1 Tax=Haloarchaeobius sp. DT45 TaxID=3446116 RepID=UPI003F6CF331
MSLSAVLLYAVLDELPHPHSRVALSLVPVAILGTVIRLGLGGQVGDRLGLSVALLAGLVLVATVVDGLRRTRSTLAGGHDTRS